MSQPSHNSSQEAPPLSRFDQVTGLASSFSMGTAAAFVASLKQINPTLEIRADLLTLVCFVIGFGITWWVYKIVFDESNDLNNPNRRKRVLLFFGISSLLALCSCMGIALKGISNDKLKDVGFGVAIAIFFISIAAFFFFKVVRFLEHDELNNSLDEDG